MHESCVLVNIKLIYVTLLFLEEIFHNIDLALLCSYGEKTLIKVRLRIQVFLRLQKPDCNIR